MKNILKLEEAAMFGLSIYALSFLGVEWWWYLILALGPDIGMVGYLVNNKAGAVSYNLLHHKGIAIALLIIGSLTENVLVGQIGIVLFGHVSMDRLFGYGLKHSNGFKFTHLGEIGKK
jgi:hypothetical protein